MQVYSVHHGKVESKWLVHHYFQQDFSLICDLNDTIEQPKDVELAREEIQALAKRERCEERRVRFLNARERTIGIDKEYLNKQVKEREEQRLKAKEEEAREGMTEA